MASVAIVNAVYSPEPMVSAQMGRDLAVHLAQSGACVTVLCPFPSRPIGADYSVFRAIDVPRVELDIGVKIVRLPSFRAPQSKFFSRMRESFCFGQHVTSYLRRHLSNVDVVYANTWPLFSQALIARHCAKRGIPLVLHIQDIYPESLLGKLPSWCRGAVTAPFKAMDRWTSRQARTIVVISEGMRRTYVGDRRIPAERVVTIPNWQNEELFATMPPRREACARYRLAEDRLTFLYLGNIGPVAGVDLLIRAFTQANVSNAQLLIVGGGSAKAASQELARHLGAGNVHFVSDPDAKNVPLLQSMAHVCLLPMKRGAGRSSIPSKLPAYLFSAKPVLATLDAESDTARCIQEAQCGWVGEPENVRWLANKMSEIAVMPVSELSEIGQRGRCYGLRHFSKALGVRRLVNVVRNATRGSWV